MAQSSRAGQPPLPQDLIDPKKLDQQYFENKPDPVQPAQRVSFGTSGHRGSPEDSSFTESHILAITQAVCDYRKRQGIDGPLYIGKDTHAVDQPATRTAIQVLAANEVQTLMAGDDAYTPTPVISHAILTYNRGRTSGLCDGIIVTPSHNPPRDGGIKYNPPHGGPADKDVTQWIQDRANQLLVGSCRDVRRLPYDKARASSFVKVVDLVTPYVGDLNNVIDFDLIRSSGVRIGVDPLGGASVQYWQPIAERYKLNLTVVNSSVDYTFSFMTLDHDGQIRMDCSSPDAMAGLIKLKDRYDIAFGNDTDADRHGIVTPSAGLMNPNHYLAVAIQYLFMKRAGWSKEAAVGKTLVSSSVIDKVAQEMSRKLYEVPVGFKWFSPGLYDGSLGFGGEESAGASFLRKDGRVWTTDKDGLILGLLAAEITARTGQDPGVHYHAMEQRFGTSYYRRVDAPATPEQKARLGRLSADAVNETELAGEKIVSKLTAAPGNHAPIGGLKVTTAHGWFAARPSGTEDVYKIYAESLKSREHLEKLLVEAKQLVGRVLGQ